MMVLEAWDLALAEIRIFRARTPPLAFARHGQPRRRARGGADRNGGL